MTHNPVQGAVNVSTGLFVFIPLVSNSHGSLPNTTSVVPFVSLSFSPYASRAFPLYSCCNLSLSLSLARSLSCSLSHSLSSSLRRFPSLFISLLSVSHCLFTIYVCQFLCVCASLSPLLSLTQCHFSTLSLSVCLLLNRDHVCSFNDR